uniref:Uncharacterized protein n=1 Tax=Arundo donax TaxID=35708 RepID=A0A0A9E5B6_ARUDO
MVSNYTSTQRSLLKLKEAKWCNRVAVAPVLRSCRRLPFSKPVKSEKDERCINMRSLLPICIAKIE